MPYIHGTPMSVPNMFTVQFHAMRILRGKFPGIVEALDGWQRRHVPQA